jgi:hypothetical protein
VISTIWKFRRRECNIYTIILCGCLSVFVQNFKIIPSFYIYSFLSNSTMLSDASQFLNLNTMMEMLGKAFFDREDFYDRKGFRQDNVSFLS